MRKPKQRNSINRIFFLSSQNFSSFFFCINFLVTWHYIGMSCYTKRCFMFYVCLRETLWGIWGHCFTCRSCSISFHSSVSLNDICMSKHVWLTRSYYLCTCMMAVCISYKVDFLLFISITVHTHPTRRIHLNILWTSHPRQENSI